MIVEHKGLGLALDLPELRQRDVEAFYAAMRALDPDWRKQPAVERAGDYARAAVRLGWYTGCDEAGIAGMSPAAVWWIGAQVDSHVYAALKIPPE